MTIENKYVYKLEHNGKIFLCEDLYEMLNALDGTVIFHDRMYKAFFVDARYHREDGPAIEFYDGHKEWYINGKLHKEDGPAVIYASGNKVWYLNGNRIMCSSNEEFLRMKNLLVFF